MLASFVNAKLQYLKVVASSASVAEPASAANRLEALSDELLANLTAKLAGVEKQMGMQMDEATLIMQDIAACACLPPRCADALHNLVSSACHGGSARGAVVAQSLTR